MRAAIVGLLTIILGTTQAASQVDLLMEVDLGIGIRSVQHSYTITQDGLSFPVPESVVAPIYSTRLGVGLALTDEFNLFARGSLSLQSTTQSSTRSVPFIVDGVTTQGSIEQTYNATTTTYGLELVPEFTPLSWLSLRGLVGMGFNSISALDVTETILQPDGLVFAETGTSQRQSSATFTSDNVPYLRLGLEIATLASVSRHLDVVPSVSGHISATQADATSGWTPWGVRLGVGLRYQPNRAQVVEPVEPEPIVVDSVVDVVAPVPPDTVVSDQPSPSVLTCALQLKRVGNSQDLQFKIEASVIADEPTKTTVTIDVNGSTVDRFTSDQHSISRPLDLRSIVESGDGADQGLVRVSMQTTSRGGEICKPLPSTLTWKRSNDGSIKVGR